MGITKKALFFRIRAASSRMFVCIVADAASFVKGVSGNLARLGLVGLDPADGIVAVRLDAQGIDRADKEACLIREAASIERCGRVVLGLRRQAIARPFYQLMPRDGPFHGWSPVASDIDMLTGPRPSRSRGWHAR